MLLEQWDVDKTAITWYSTKHIQPYCLGKVKRLAFHYMPISMISSISWGDFGLHVNDHLHFYWRDRANFQTDNLQAFLTAVCGK